MPIYLQHGNLIDYVPPTDTSTEDVVFMGGLVGVPQAFIPAGELGALSVDGVYIFNKKDGVAVNLGDVVKYCGTTKLAQDSNADLTLGVAVADAEANDIGVRVKINSVLPTDGGGGGEVAVSCGLAINEEGELFVKVASGCGLAFNDNGQLVATGGGGGGGGGGEIAVNCGLRFHNGFIGINLDDSTSGLGLTEYDQLMIKVCTASGLSIDENGELVASGGGGGGEIDINTNAGLGFDSGGLLEVKIAGGLEFDRSGYLEAKIGGGLEFDCSGYFSIKVCTASGLSIDENGYLVYNG